MRYLISFFLFLSLNLFAVTCSSTTASINTGVNYTSSAQATSTCQSIVGRYYYNITTSSTLDPYTDSPTDPAKTYYHINGYTSFTVSGTPGKITCASPATKILTASCSSNTIFDPNSCSCVSNTCSWATTPPWVPSYRNQSECSNANKGSGVSTENLSYLWNWRWCDAGSKCYGLEYSCPVGTIYDPNEQICRAPKEPYQPDCGSCGTYKQSGSIEGPAGKMCYIDYICKCNPKIRTRIDVSCNAGPIEPDPEDPLHPTEDPEPNPSGPNKNPNDHSTKCGTDKMVAKSQCDAQPGKVLKFECNPLTGISRSSCEYPNGQPTLEPILPGDETKGSTTEDIKNLANNLPANIKEALGAFLSDGSMPYLESIKGSLEATTILDADRNTKLDSISSSIDAGLILQTDANEKLDGVKTSIDGVKTSIDSQKSTLDQISDFFNDETEYEGEDMPTNGDMSPDSNTSDGFETFTNSVTAIQQQFNQAQAIFSGGVPLVDLGGGSCPTYQFMGKSVSISSIGQSIAPYSSIFSILIYISLMINIFRMIFGFFSKGV